MGDVKLSPQSVDRSREEAYSKNLTSPLGNFDLELNLDCKDEHILQEYQNFDPKKILKILIDRAAAQNISPEQFQEDIRQMSQPNRNFTQYCLPGKKYDVKLKSNDPDTVTYERIGIMYPHYYVFLFKPGFSSYCSGFPAHFRTIAFGGLIPTSTGNLKPELRKSIITMHLYCMFHLNKSMLFRTHQVLLKRKIESGLLSDDRRIRFLEIHEVLTDAGDDLSAETKKALKLVGTEFCQRISWAFFD